MKNFLFQAHYEIGYRLLFIYPIFLGLNGSPMDRFCPRFELFHVDLVVYII